MFSERPADESARLLAQLWGSDRDVREAAAWGLAQSHKQDDVCAVLDLFERADAEHDSGLIELVLEALSTNAAVAIDPLTHRIRRTPTSGSGRVAAAALAELAHYPEWRPDPRLIPAVTTAVRRSLEEGTWSAPEAVAALHELAAEGSNNEAAQTMAAVLEQGATEADPYERVLRQAVELLTAHGREDLLAPVVDRLPSLPVDHPLRTLLQPSGGSR